MNSVGAAEGHSGAMSDVIHGAQIKNEKKKLIKSEVQLVERATVHFAQQ